MKEKTLVEMKNKIVSQNRVIEYMLNEVSRLQELGIGTLETVKLMPGYTEALATLKQKMEENVERKLKEENKDGTIK
jgi:hypothetical protein